MSFESRSRHVVLSAIDMDLEGEITIRTHGVFLGVLDPHWMLVFNIAKNASEFALWRNTGPHLILAH